MKGQILADLVVEFTEELGGSEEVRRPKEAVRVGSVVVHQAWQLFVDGVTNQKGSGIRIVMISPNGITLEKSLRLDFSATNNEADYEALLAGLITMQKLRGRIIRAYCDARLIVGQVRVDFEAKDLRIHWYVNQVKRLSRGFHSFTLE